MARPRRRSHNKDRDTAMNASKKHLLTPVLALAALLSLGACQTTDLSVKGFMKPVDSLQGEKAETKARREEAARDALNAGDAETALKLYGEMHKEKPSNRKVALQYAELLRKSERPQEAIKVMSPFALDIGGAPKQNAAPEALLELASAYIAAGDFDAGERMLNAVLENQKAKKYHIEAYNLMGVVLDTKGQHREAEHMFREALEGWQGNPAAVMNNLALSLASQGLFDQSLTTLRKALVISPDKQEVARNIQIVSDLRDNIVPSAPLRLPPGKKIITPRRSKTKPPAACPPCPAPGEEGTRG